MKVAAHIALTEEKRLNLSNPLLCVFIEKINDDFNWKIFKKYNIKYCVNYCNCFYTPAQKERGYTILSLCDCLSVANFCRVLLILQMLEF